MIRPVGPRCSLGFWISKKLSSDALVTGSCTRLITHSGEHPFRIQVSFGTYLFIFTFRSQSKWTERVPCQCFVKCHMVRKLSYRSPSWKPCICPASRLKKKPEIGDRHHWLTGCGILHVWRGVLEWHPIMGSRQQAGCGGRLHGWGCGRLPVIGGMDVQLAYGNQQRGMPLTTPLISYHSGNTSDLKMKTITTGAGTST